jgi:hypothetical protein
MCQLWLRLGANFRELRYGEVRRILLKRTSQNAQNANFGQTEFYEVQLQVAERFSVRRVMSSSCSQPSPTKE